MTHPIIQVEYEQMAGLSQRMRGRAEACGALRQRLQQALTPLQQGGWYGRGATAFFHEMESDVLPAMNRLETALTEGQLVLDEIVRIFQQAEAEAAALFQGGLTAPPVTPGSQRDRVNGADRSGADHADAPSTPSPVSTSEIFSHSYMRKMVGRKWPNEGDPALRQAMYDLRENQSPEKVEQALKVIAEKSDGRMTLEQAREQHKIFLEKRKEAESVGIKIHELAQIPIRADYMGSRDHLRFGQIVGDALGLDPIFGALLNPTGGIVGPDNYGLALNESALGYHAAFHDAGGFLHTYFGKGPGYDYLGLEPGRFKDNPLNPLVGQQSGVLYWNAMVSSRLSLDKLRNPLALIADSQHGIGLSTIVTTGLGVYVDVTKVLPKVYDQAKQTAQDVKQRVEATAVDMAEQAIKEAAKFAITFLK